MQHARMGAFVLRRTVHSQSHSHKTLYERVPCALNQTCPDTLRNDLNQIKESFVIFDRRGLPKKARDHSLTAEWEVVGLARIRERVRLRF